MIGINGTIVVAQIGAEPGNLQLNLERILDRIDEAREAGAELIVFPELATTGYVLGDRWEHDAFIDEIEEANTAICGASDGITVVWGSLKADWKKIGQDGRVRKYNAAFIARNRAWIENGALSGWIPKTNLPKYRIFDDARHFYPAGLLADEVGIPLEKLLRPFPVPLGGAVRSIALAVCEDLWEDEYSDKPSRIYGAQHADLMIDLSCSPWTHGKWHARERMLTMRVADAGIPILYVNAVGLENNTKNLIWFDGDSALVNKDGEFVWRGAQHRAQAYTLNLAGEGVGLPERRNGGIGEIHDALLAATAEFYKPFPKIVIGLSGGVDSAVSAAVLAEALGPTSVLAVNMPTEFNSRTTQDLAKECASRLGIEYRVVPIQSLYEAHRETLAHAGYPAPKALTLENVQARIRGASVLAAIAQEENGAFANNGNKTEVALNYFTLYGDGAGAAAFLADLWKGQVYELARYINGRAGYDVIPEGILAIVPSAELSKDQAVDEGKGDPIFFPYHDNLLRAFTEWRWDPTKVLAHAVSGDLEEKLECEPGTLKRYFKDRASFVENLEWAWKQYSREFKRGQTPPVFLCSRRAFGFDRRDTIRDAYFTRAYKRFREVYLAGALETA